MKMAATAAVYCRLHNNSVGVGSGGGPGSGSSMGGHHHQLARSLERILEEAHFSGELILTNRKLKDFPKTSTKYILTDTVIADLSRNRFCELPEEITTFVFLETLLLYHNTVRTITESIKNLTSLTYLDLRSNQLLTLPRELCFLPLQVLLVSNNRLIALPDELGRIDRLSDLDVSYNQLTSLPPRIGELRSLRSFSLRSNQLTYLPRELTCLTLISLDISNNRISSLPLEIRQMTTLVELTLENNPLTSPPASLCVRGLVHIFKYLDTQAAKDEKGLRIGGNYDGYTTLRRAPRHLGNGNHNILGTIRTLRHQIDSGYSTSDGIDKRWSHDMPLKAKYETALCLPTSSSSSTTIVPSKSLLINVDSIDDSLTSSTNTVDDESIVQFTNNKENCMLGKANKLQLSLKNEMKGLEKSAILNYAGHTGQYLSSSSNGSTPDLELKQSPQHVWKLDDKNRNFGNIQTYREYKEALKQQRNQEVCKIKESKYCGELSNGQANNLIIINNEQKQLSNEMANPLSDNHSNNNRGNSRNYQIGPITLKSIMKTNANVSLNYAGVFEVGEGRKSHVGGTANVVTPKKPVQKVIPSRHSELTAKVENSQLILPNNKLCAIISNNDINGLNNGEGDADCIVYMKPNSPIKSSNSNLDGSIDTNNTETGVGIDILTNNNMISIESPIAGNVLTKVITNGKVQRNVTWNRDITPEKLSFTMRREFDRQREEIELISQLRNIIESRLKMTLPDDVASALMDGVILCHLANYVRPRSVASIHVPSPGVSKLTMARCRRNVDNFLEACRKIGVADELICSYIDIMSYGDDINAFDKDDDSNDNTVQENINVAINNCMNNNNSDHFIKKNEQDKALKQCTTPNFKNIQYESMGNIIAVLKTVAALISLDNNPCHRNIRNLQQQHELQIKLQSYERQHKNNQHKQSITTLKQIKQNSQTTIIPKHTNFVPNFGVKLKGLDEEDIELNTELKEYHQMDDEDIEVYSYEEESNIEINAIPKNCENGQLTATSTKEQMIKRMSSRVFRNGNCCSENSENFSENIYNCVNNVVAIQQEACINYDEIGGKKNFCRPSTLKTFQTIKLNLTTAHGNNCHIGAASLNANNKKSRHTLPAIVEIESDACSTPSQRNINNNELIHYTHFIDKIIKKSNTIEHRLNMKKAFGSGTCDTTDHCNNDNNNDNLLATQNKYKLLELPIDKTNVIPSVPIFSSSSIMKRIEFFEHANIPNGGIIKPKTNIYSIYRVNELVEDEKHVKDLIKNKKLNAATYFLRHDSQGLTLLLSVIFIVTFLLLIFFPLPS